MDVTVMGLTEDNPFFDASPKKSQRRVQISSAMAEKYHLKVGDEFLVSDDQNDRAYGFTVDGIVTYSPVIDRSAGSIALFKVFGYRKKELGKLFLHGNTVLIAVGCVIVIPLSKIIMDAIYPYLVANVACGMNLTFPWWIYAAVFAGIMAVYFLIHALLVRRIGQVDLGEVLKTRE